MISAVHKVEILDSNLAPITQIKALAKLDTQGNFLRYSTKLSDFGQAKFRVATRDPLFTSLGDIFQPFKNHVRITRNGVIVWQGVIVDVPERQRNYVEVVAYEYEWLFKRKIIPSNTSDNLYYQMDHDTLAYWVNDIVTKVKNNVGANHIFSQLGIGTITNPTYPLYFTDSNKNNIGGQSWTFSPTFLLKVDFKDAFYILNELAMYSVCDWQVIMVNGQLTFNYQPFIGNRQPQLVFAYGPTGSIENYNIPLHGERMVNNILGLGMDYDLNFLQEWRSDQASVNTYGALEAVGAYSDAKSVDLLRSRMAEQLVYTATPDSEIQVTLNEKAYPLGQYGLGDTVTIQIKDHFISTNSIRRIVAINVDVQDSGAERISLITNVPRS